MVGSNRCTPGADARRAKRRSRDASCATIRRRRPLVLAEAAQTMRAGRGVELTVGVDAARSVAAVATRRRDGVARVRRRARLALASIALRVQHAVDVALQQRVGAAFRDTQQPQIA